MFDLPEEINIFGDWISLMNITKVETLIRWDGMGIITRGHGGLQAMLPKVKM